MLNVYAFDPGETTGWAHVTVHNDGGMGLFSCGEGNHLEIGNMLFDNGVLKSVSAKREIEMIFIVEKFIMNAKITQSPWSLETTGLIRYFGIKHHIPVVEQTPSQVKNLISNDVLKRAEMYEPGKGHAQDASRHALFFLVTKKGLFKECLRP